MQGAPRLVGGHRRHDGGHRLGERRRGPGERAPRERLARRVLPRPQRAADAAGDMRPVRADARAQTVPVGRRDLWLHVQACALAWIDPGADIAEALVTLAADAAPGLSAREVRTCAGTVARRARDAVAGRHGARGGDPRYGYRGATIAELLGIDAGLATRLGLEQIIPEELRTARRARARTARRRAAGVMPRALWLAQNPTSREEPWIAEGISKATWYRRLKEQRDRRARACLADLGTGAAILTPCRETGAASLYEGEALPGGMAEEPSSPAIPACPVKRPPSRPSPTIARPPRAIPSPDPAPSPQAGAAHRVEPPLTDQAEASAASAPTPSHPQPPDAADPETLAMPAPLDPATLAAAAARLAPTELGWLVRVVAGPDSTAALAGLDADVRARLVPWLRRDANQAVVGLRVPDPDPVTPRRSAQLGIGCDLFDLVRPARPPLTPPVMAGAPTGGRQPTVKQTAIAEGVRLVMGAGKSEDTARRVVGRLFRDLRDGVVCEAIAAAVRRADEIAEPVGWMRAYADHQYGAAARRPQHRSATAVQVGAVPPCPQQLRAIATPEELGISPERARKIRERNRLLAARG